MPFEVTLIWSLLKNPVPFNTPTNPSMCCRWSVPRASQGLMVDKGLEPSRVDTHEPMMLNSTVGVAMIRLCMTTTSNLQCSMEVA